MSGLAHIPPGQSPPFATVTPTDHRAWIIIATAFPLSITLLFSVIRVFIRATLRPGWRTDDYPLLVSTVFCCIQCALILKASADGLGKSIDLIPERLHGKIQELYYAGNILYVLSLGLTKISLILFIRELKPSRLHQMTSYVLLGLVAVWMVAGIFASAFTCDTSHPWLLVGQTCPGWYTRWEVIEIIGGLFEIATVCMGVWLVWRLQLRLSQKSTVVIAFSFRLVLLVFIGLKLSSFNQHALTTDPFLHEADFICWTEISMNYAVIAATIPIIRELLADLSTHQGGSPGFGGYTYGSGGGYTRFDKPTAVNNSFPMRTLKSADRSRNGRGDTIDQEIEDDGTYSYNIRGAPRQGYAPGGDAVEQGKGYNGNGDARSMGSGDSQKMIIKKDITWEVS